MSNIKIPKGFFKQLSIYRTFKFSIYNTNSLLVYFKIIKLSFSFKILKENIEYVEENEIDYIKSRILMMKQILFSSINTIPLNQPLNQAKLILEFIIDQDLQPLYDVFRKLDKLYFYDKDSFNLKKKMIFYIQDIQKDIDDLLTKIPTKKKKKLIRFNNYIERIINDN